MIKYNDEREFLKEDNYKHVIYIYLVTFKIKQFYKMVNENQADKHKLHVENVLVPNLKK